MLKIKDNELQISSAGMPATLIYRDATKQVEEIFIKAMPFGTMVNFPYEQRQVLLSKDDCVVILSDGFPEMFNPQNEMLGFNKVAEILSQFGVQPPQEIINRLGKLARNGQGRELRTMISPSLF